MYVDSLSTQTHTVPNRIPEETVRITNPTVPNRIPEETARITNPTVLNIIPEETARITDSDQSKALLQIKKTPQKQDRHQKYTSILFYVAFLIWRRHHCRRRAANLGLCFALMTF